MSEIPANPPVFQVVVNDENRQLVGEAGTESDAVVLMSAAFSRTGVDVAVLDPSGVAVAWIST